MPDPAQHIPADAWRMIPRPAQASRSYWFWMRPPTTNLSRIVREVAERRGVAMEDLLGPSRRKPIAHARQEAMWELRHQTQLSYSSIAARVGRTDHTTAWHGIKAHEARRAAR